MFVYEKPIKQFFLLKKYNFKIYVLLKLKPKKKKI